MQRNPIPRMLVENIHERIYPATLHKSTLKLTFIRIHVILHLKHYHHSIQTNYHAAFKIMINKVRNEGN